MQQSPSSPTNPRSAPVRTPTTGSAPGPISGRIIQPQRHLGQSSSLNRIQKNGLIQNLLEGQARPGRLIRNASASESIVSGVRTLAPSHQDSCFQDSTPQFRSPETHKGHSASLFTRNPQFLAHRRGHGFELLFTLPGGLSAQAVHGEAGDEDQPSKRVQSSHRRKHDHGG